MTVGYDGKRFFHNNTGLGNYSRSLIKVLSSHFPSNEYLLYNPKKSKKYNLNGYENCVTEILPSNFFSKKLTNLWRLIFMSHSINKKNITIYHGLSGEIPIGISQKVKKIVTIHDLIFVRYPHLYSYFDRKIHFWKFKHAAQKADIVIAISEQTKKDIAAFLKIKEDKIKVIYQGCNSVYKKTFSETELNTTAVKYNLPEKYILNVGTIEKRKNLLLLIKSIQNTDRHVVVIGKKTAYYEDVKKYIESNNLVSQVHFLKDLTLIEMAIVYQKATLFVYPSVFEGFGIPIIEALYSRTPVITSIGSCFAEAGGLNSIYINPKSETELKIAISTVWDNQEILENMKQKGFEYVQKFNDDVLANNWIKVYQTLI